nr:immunoglobulin heavy chain junction region [Macaca mulatta]MOX38174.1 immunoglobulin heavy chain junction region [Macaca mulatta]MOX38795.1 immunoglobulin heavy chain junction region [Macaca mulatta]MOX38927.1 immunoglobulin heavy chain junction region [Macaca mulatta]MOX41052.1 immunoglobulin heavy chain junction region [Macaca mulatta]
CAREYNSWSMWDNRFDVW